VDRLHRSRLDRIKLIEAGVLTCTLAAESADCVIAPFGLKAFDRRRPQPARTLARVLKRRGCSC
jgi:ubiquinone/menaquinone biosynthesis C-methylase UbiE